jgi:hypothetical protein
VKVGKEAGFREVQQQRWNLKYLFEIYLRPSREMVITP